MSYDDTKLAIFKRYVFFYGCPYKFSALNSGVEDELRQLTSSVLKTVKFFYQNANPGFARSLAIY